MNSFEKNRNNHAEDFKEDDNFINDDLRDEDFKYLNREYFSNREYLLNPNSRHLIDKKEEVDFNSSGEYNVNQNRDKAKEEENIIEMLLSLFEFHKIINGILQFLTKLLNLVVALDDALFSKFKIRFKIQNLIRKLMLFLQTMLMLKMIEVLLKLKRQQYQSVNAELGEKFEYIKQKEFFKGKDYSEKERHRHHDRSDNERSKEYEKTSDEKSREKSKNKYERSEYISKYKDFDLSLIDKKGKFDSIIKNVSYLGDEAKIHLNHELHSMHDFNHVVDQGVNAKHSNFLDQIVNKVIAVSEYVVNTVYNAAKDTIAEIAKKVEGRDVRFEGYRNNNHFRDASKHDEYYHGRNQRVDKSYGYDGNFGTGSGYYDGQSKAYKDQSDIMHNYKRNSESEVDPVIFIAKWVIDIPRVDRLDFINIGFNKGNSHSH